MKIKCHGTTYARATRIVEQVADKDHYELATAVCDYCGYRLTLLGGRRIPSHYLDVTVHGVVI